MKLDEVTDDREAQSETTDTPGHGGVRLTETVENDRQELGGDPLARIRDDENYLRAFRSKGDANVAQRIGELDRVRKQVPHDLLNALGIGHQETRRRVGRKLDFELFCV